MLHTTAEGGQQKRLRQLKPFSIEPEHCWSRSKAINPPEVEKSGRSRRIKPSADAWTSHKIQCPSESKLRYAWVRPAGRPAFTGLRRHKLCFLSGAPAGKRKLRFGARFWHGARWKLLAACRTPAARKPRRRNCSMLSNCANL